MFDKYENYIVDHDTNFNEGEQYLFKFENGYGASVIKTDYSLGNECNLWELAVITWEKIPYCFMWELCCDTPLTSDVLGYLSEEDVCKYLEDIKRLKEKTDD